MSAVILLGCESSTAEHEVLTNGTNWAAPAYAAHPGGWATPHGAFALRCQRTSTSASNTGSYVTQNLVTGSNWRMMGTGSQPQFSVYPIRVTFYLYVDIAPSGTGTGDLLRLNNATEGNFVGVRLSAANIWAVNTSGTASAAYGYSVDTVYRIELTITSSLLFEVFTETGTTALHSVSISSGWATGATNQPENVTTVNWGYRLILSGTGVLTDIYLDDLMMCDNEHTFNFEGGSSENAQTVPGQLSSRAAIFPDTEGTYNGEFNLSTGTDETNVIDDWTDTSDYITTQTGGTNIRRSSHNLADYPFGGSDYTFKACTIGAYSVGVDGVTNGANHELGLVKTTGPVRDDVNPFIASASNTYAFVVVECDPNGDTWTDARFNDCETIVARDNGAGDNISSRNVFSLILTPFDDNNAGAPVAAAPKRFVQVIG